MKRVLVTGANGFVGSSVVSILRNHHLDVLSAVRTPDVAGFSDQNAVAVGDINATTDWAAALAEVSTIIHCAAKVHVMSKVDEEIARQFHEVNVEGTINLARQALAAGVSRFIFLSSIKVIGESTSGRSPFTHEDMSNPQDPYARSKTDAEIALRELLESTSMQLIIIRPPLIYGPGVKANFLRLVKLVNSGVPLPFANAKNRRSMVYIENLVDLLRHCVQMEHSVSGTFLVCDDDDLAMPDLLQCIANGLGKRARLFPFPTNLIKLMCSVVGLGRYYERMFGELQVNTQHTRKSLGWQPPVATRKAVAATAEHWSRVSNLK